MVHKSLSRSPLGFLYFGDASRPSEIAYSMAHGIPEPFELWMVDFFLPRVSTFIDVGCNTGLYCCRAAQKLAGRGQVVAFDPQPVCLGDLAATIAANGWEQTLRTVPVALGAHEADDAVLHLAGTGSSLDPGINGEAGERATCPVRTLDGECQRLGIARVDFVKIDVEGWELPVLHGAAKMIGRDRPTLFVEIADRLRGREFRNPRYAETIKWLQDSGYTVLRCREDFRLERVEEPDPQPHLNMYLCIDARRGSAFRLALDFWAFAFRLRQTVARARFRAREVGGRVLPAWLRRPIKKLVSSA